MKELLLILSLMMLQGIFNIVSAAEMAIVIDAPLCIVTDANSMKSISAKLEKKISPKGYTLVNILETNVIVQNYRKILGNDEIDLQRHDGMKGYANELSLNDLREIGDVSKADYLLSIQAIGKFNDTPKTHKSINLDAVASVFTGKVPIDKTHLDLKFEFKLYKISNMKEINVEKFVIMEKGTTPYSVKEYEKFYKKAFMFGINNAELNF